MVWACLFKELLEVVCGWSCLTPAAAHARHCRQLRSPNGAACVSSCHPWRPPRCPDGDIERSSPAAAQGSVMLGHLGADGVMGGDAVPLLGGVLEGIGRCLGRPSQLPAMRVAARLSYQ
jgi:hypothetical protein